MDSNPLSSLLREAIEGDAELRKWVDEARQRRLRVRPLPPLLYPARFTGETLARLGGIPPAPRWTWGVANPWRAWVTQNVRWRVAWVLTAVFDPLRSGELGATGFVPGTGDRTAVPPAAWAFKPAVQVDLRMGGLLAGATTLFAAVAVDAPSMREPLSEAAAKEFIRQFAAKLEESGRTFSTAEATETLQRAYPGAPATTAKQVRRLLRETQPNSWANGGRRARFQIPTATEIATAGEAARQAAETRP